MREEGGLRREEEFFDKLLSWFLGLLAGPGETVTSSYARMMNLCLKLDPAPSASRKPTENEKISGLDLLIVNGAPNSATEGLVMVCPLRHRKYKLVSAA